MISHVVLDTNVLVAGLRSNRGASYRVLQLVGTGRFEMHVSVALIFEYEEVLKRMAHELRLKSSEIDDFLDYVCSASSPHEINFLWRPFLRDPDDDMVLEVAVQAGCRTIVTHNIADFRGSESLGVHAAAPREFLRMIGEMP